MKRVLLSFFVMLSLLLTPVAHAIGVDGDECHSESTTKKEANQDNDDGKLVNSTHHCCCAPASLKTDVIAQVFQPTISTASMALADDNMTSVVVGPLLEPPSHA